MKNLDVKYALKNPIFTGEASQRTNIKGGSAQKGELGQFAD